MFFLIKFKSEVKPKVSYIKKKKLSKVNRVIGFGFAYSNISIISTPWIISNYSILEKKNAIIPSLD